MPHLSITRARVEALWTDEFLGLSVSSWLPVGLFSFSFSFFFPLDNLGLQSYYLSAVRGSGYACNTHQKWSYKRKLNQAKVFCWTWDLCPDINVKRKEKHHCFPKQYSISSNWKCFHINTVCFWSFFKYQAYLSMNDSHFHVETR